MAAGGTQTGHRESLSPLAFLWGKVVITQDLPGGETGMATTALVAHSTVLATTAPRLQLFPKGARKIPLVCKLFPRRFFPVLLPNTFAAAGAVSVLELVLSKLSLTYLA